MNISPFFIEDQRKIRMFVFIIRDVNMHAEQALLTFCIMFRDFPFMLKRSFCFFFHFSFLLVVSQNNTFSFNSLTNTFMKIEKINSLLGALYTGYFLGPKQSEGFTLVMEQSYG